MGINNDDFKRAAIAAAAVCAAGFAQADTIEFDTNFGIALLGGAVVSDFDFGGGLTGSASAVGNNANSPDVALVFDTTEMMSDDPDLQSPFTLVGSGGAVSRGFGNAIIVQENPASNGVFTPDDDGSGGVLSFVFDNLIELGVLSLLDVRENTSVTLFNDDVEIDQLFTANADTNNTTTPNLFTTVDFNNQVGNRFVIDFNGRSGGLGEFEATSIAPVPLPAAGWMLVAGIGGMMALRRRKKA